MIAQVGNIKKLLSMDDADKVVIDPIPEMPEFKAVDHHYPGVEKQKLDDKTQSIVDAFSVVDQQIRWLSKIVVEVNKNIITSFIEAQKARASASEAIRLVSELENKPYKNLWNAAKVILTLAAGGLLTGFFEWIFKNLK